MEDIKDLRGIILPGGESTTIGKLLKERNAYGSQIDSFEKGVKIEEVSSEPIPLIFIRAPLITEVFNDVKIICTVDDKIVAARQNNMFATAFHHELTDNLEVHRYFINMCKQN